MQIINFAVLLLFSRWAGGDIYSGLGAAIAAELRQRQERLSALINLILSPTIITYNYHNHPFLKLALVLLNVLFAIKKKKINKKAPVDEAAIPTAGNRIYFQCTVFMCWTPG